MFKQLVAVLVLSWSSLSWAGLDIQTWKTKNGAEVLFVESKQLPMLDVQITFDAGSARDDKDWGLAAMTSALLGLETVNKDEAALADAFNSLGAQFSTDSSRDSASVSLRTLTRPEIMASAVDTFAEVLAQPKFDAKVFERERQRWLIGLKQRSVKPQTIASDSLWETLYGDHPYAHPTSGTEQSINALTPNQLEVFYQRYYVAKNATIAVVGNVSRQQAEEIAQQLSAQLKSGQRADAIAAVKHVPDSQRVITEFDSTQTYYYWSQVGIQRGHEDYVALFVGNHLLGGNGFGSLLMEEVREKRGLVYSVYSYFAPMKQSGPFIIGLSTKNASALEAEKVVHETLDGFLKDIDEQMLRDIKDNLIGGFPLRMDSNGKILGYLSLIGFYDLPLDYLDQFPQWVENTTKADVLAAWKKHIQPEKMVTVMVGKPE